MDFLSGLISPISSLIGGIFGQSNAAKQAEANRQAQYDFAQHGIQWKVADARAAGINPLAALGASTSSFSNIVGDNSLGDAIGKSGQDLGRAAAAAMAKPSRADELNEKLLEAKIANVNADTVRQQALASEMMTRLGQPATGPGVNVPYPTPDPRGPVIQLYQRAYDYRKGEIIDIPSEKAASPLQTIAASPINAAMAARTVGDALSYPFVGSPGGGFVAPGAVGRAVDNYNWTYGVP